MKRQVRTKQLSLKAKIKIKNLSEQSSLLDEDQKILESATFSSRVLILLI